MTAMELYREDRKNRKKPEARMPRQEYFSLLRDTLHDELMREGRSDFLDEMLAECAGGRALPMLEFAALRECYGMIVEKQPLQDASEYVPHIYRSESERFAWRDLTQNAYRVDNPEFHADLCRLRAVCQQLVRVRDDTFTPDPDSAVQQELFSAMTLNRALERDNAALREERDKLRARLAEMESGYIDEHLKMRLDVRVRQEEARLAQELQARREAEEAAMLRRLADAAQARMDDERIAGEQALRRADEYAQLHEKLARQAEEMREQLDRQLRGLQGELFAADHRFLAKSYAELSAAAEAGLSRVLAAAQHQGADEALNGELAALQAALSGHMKQMEQALMQLGLRVFRPRAGEAFDPAVHSPVSAGAQDALPEMSVVERMETPGVMLNRRAGQPGEVLLRAVVRTARRDEA